MVYVGAKNGSIYVFESLSGHFFKEIPFQAALFQSKRMGESKLVCPPVTRVQVNQVNHLQVAFGDMTTLTLDQEAKTLLSAKQGRGPMPAMQLKMLPL